MQYFDSLDSVSFENVWLTIGSFDGVHKGHQAILRQLVAGASAKGVPAVVLTFHPHPASILRNRTGRYYITTPMERAVLMGQLGVDVVITYPFSKEVAGKTADEFIAELHQHLKMKQILVGHDFALGKNRQGTPDYLAGLGEKYGFQVGIFEAITLSDEIVSSSLVRAALAEGDAARVFTMLGRPYTLKGEVVHGDGRGRTIGIPTANLKVEATRAVPAAGVYACTLSVAERTYGAVTNIGTRPTFDQDDEIIHIEAHILDFSGDIYGKTIQLNFIDRLRGEQRFANASALVAQINQDIHRTRVLLKDIV